MKFHNEITHFDLLDPVFSNKQQMAYCISPFKEVGAYPNVSSQSIQDHLMWPYSIASENPFFS